MNDTMNDAKDTTEIAEEMDTPTVLTLPLACYAWHCAVSRHDYAL